MIGIRGIYQWIRKARNKPCHVAYEKANDPDLKQGFAICTICGALHLTKPRLTEQAIRDMVR